MGVSRVKKQISYMNLCMYECVYDFVYLGIN